MRQKIAEEEALKHKSIQKQTAQLEIQKKKDNEAFEKIEKIIEAEMQTPIPLPKKAVPEKKSSFSPSYNPTFSNKPLKVPEMKQNPYLKAMPNLTRQQEKSSNEN